MYMVTLSAKERGGWGAARRERKTTERCILQKVFLCSIYLRPISIAHLKNQQRGCMYSNGLRVHPKREFLKLFLSSFLSPRSSTEKLATISGRSAGHPARRLCARSKEDGWW